MLYTAKGLWDMEVAEAACATILDKPEGGMIANTSDPAAFLLEYRDGFCATVLMLNGYVSAQAYGARLSGGDGATKDEVRFFFVHNQYRD